MLLIKYLVIVLTHSYLVLILFERAFPLELYFDLQDERMDGLEGSERGGGVEGVLVSLVGSLGVEFDLLGEDRVERVESGEG